MERKTLFVVFDPTREEQPALERAAAIARERPIQLHVFACIFADAEREADRAEFIRGQLADHKVLLDTAVAPLSQAGIPVTTEVEWDRDWYHAAVRASVRNHADLVLKSSYRHSTRQRLLKRTSDWTLIRECLCPVLLVKEGEQSPLRRVLAAIDIRRDDPTSRKLNQHLLDFGSEVLDAGSAELHFVNAGEDLQSLPDRNTLIRCCGVDSSRIHIQLGRPEDVIIDSARSLQANLVVVGNAARSGFSAAINGNTVEKVLDRLNCDVLSIP